MIHELPICFDCETRISCLADAVFASPFYDEDPHAPTACFHGICLMRWRERRDTVLERVAQHFRGECPDCQMPESDTG